MSTQPNATDLLSLSKDVREHLTYFQELGVEIVQLEEAFFTLPATEESSIADSGKPGVPQREPGKVNSIRPTAAVPAVRTRDNKSTTVVDVFEQIHAEIGDCARCPLHRERTNVVHTEGNKKARLMFVGEAPGADEDAQARPFVGRAGQLLTKIIEAIGLKREDVMIGNVNRCRPPGNRPPTSEEVSQCKPYLLREIAAVQPEVIVVLGNTAMRNLLETTEGISKLRGQFREFNGMKVMPTFHPAYLLRDPTKKRETWEDLKKVRDQLDRTAKQSDPV